MENIERAYDLLKTIESSQDQNKIYQISKLAFEMSNECYEAAIIYSKLTEDFNERNSILLSSLKQVKDNNAKEKLNLELAYLYYDYGMLMTSLNILKRLKVKEAKYKIMTLLTHFEDEQIEDYYKNNMDIDDGVDYVRMSFPYMIYKFKKFDFVEVEKIFKKICDFNPYVMDVIMGKVSENNDIINEAYRVFKNNAILINESPYIIKYLERYAKNDTF